MQLSRQDLSTICQRVNDGTLTVGQARIMIDRGEVARFQTTADGDDLHGLHVESEATAAELAPAPTPPRSEPSESSAKAAGGAKRSKQPGLGMGCCAAPAPRARRKPAGGKAGQAKAGRTRPELKDQAVH